MGCRLDVGFLGHVAGQVNVKSTQHTVEPRAFRLSGHGAWAPCDRVGIGRGLGGVPAGVGTIAAVP